jgi:hypothetical protein
MRAIAAPAHRPSAAIKMTPNDTIIGVGVGIGIAIEIILGMIGRQIRYRLRLPMKNAKALIHASSASQ